ncbi:MAG: hypothetical protein ACE5KW_02740, partial [Dehalococcoidia bacterium]
KKFEAVQVIPNSVVKGIGCGVHRQGDQMLITGESGGSPTRVDDFLYVLDIDGKPPYDDPVEIELPGEDVHGLVICTDRDGDEHVVLSMRVSNDVNFVGLDTLTVDRTRSMERSSSPDPKPDVADAIGNDMFIALRGAEPTTAIGALTNPDRTPGVAVLNLNDKCSKFKFGGEEDIAPMTANPNTVVVDGETVNAADPHGLEVVPR